MMPQAICLAAETRVSWRSAQSQARPFSSAKSEERLSLALRMRLPCCATLREARRRPSRVALPSSMRMASW